MTARRLRAVEDAPPFYAIAVRVSRVGGRHGERFLSPDIQISTARKAIERAGGMVDETVGNDGVFYDMDVSGAVAPDDRPGLGEALELVKSGQLAGVAVFDLSRFSRDTATGLRALEAVAAAGGTVLSASEAIDLDTAAGVFSTTVQLAAHKLRRDEASRSWKATHQRRFEMGLPHGKLPYGYVSVDGRPVPDPVLGPALAKAFADYAAGGTSQKAIAARLGQLRGRPLRQGVVSQLLRNRFYVGELEFLGQVGPGVQAPLVDEDLFARVQRRLNWERASGPHWRTPGSHVVGLVFCAECHGPMYRIGSGSRGGQPRPARLICAGVAAKTCGGVGTPQLSDVEDAVKARALKVARAQEDSTPERVERESKAVRAQSQLLRLRTRQAELLDELGELAGARSRKVMTDRAYTAAAAPVEQALDALDAQILTLEVAEEHATVPIEQLHDAARRIAGQWSVMTPLEQRAQVRLFVPRVEIRRAGYRGEPMADRLLPPFD